MRHRPGRGRPAERDRPVADARAVTLHDVAREADVAVSTVSRALSNPDRVSRAHPRARPGRRPAAGLPAESPGAARRTDAGAAGPRHHQSAQLRPDPRRGGAGPRGRLHPVLWRHPAEPRAGGRPRPNGSDPPSTVSCSPRAGCPTSNSRGWPTGRRPCCSTASSRAWPAWSSTPADGSRQIVEHLLALGHRSHRLPRGSADRLDRTSNGGGHWPARRGPRGRDHPARAVPARPSTGRRGRRRRAGQRRDARWSRSTTCWPSASCSGWRDEASRSRMRSAWSGTTTSSAPTSVTRR